jgi:galactoside O-acetyltransferase
MEDDTEAPTRACDIVPAVTRLDATRLGFARVGADVRIYELTRILAPEQITVGDHVVIDDFVMVQGGTGLEIGSYVHIASFASISGGGDGVLGSFCGIASGARVFTGSDLADGSGLIGPGVPQELRAVERSRTEIGQHAFVCANAVVLAGVRVGTGAVLGAGAVASKDLEPWTIYVGSPARAVKARPSRTILERARSLGFEDPDA